MEDGYTNYTIRMTEDKRDEWKQVADESEQFGSLSQLIRYSVKNQIERMEQEQSKEEQEIIDHIEAENSRLRDLLNDIQDNLQEIQDSHLTTTEAEALTHQRTQTILQNYNDE